MELPSAFEFGGWTIQYGLMKSNSSSLTDSSCVSNLVFVHGTPWSSAVYKPIIEALLTKGHYNILVYDLPGYGRSQKYQPSHGVDVQSTHQHGFQGDTSVRFQAQALAALLQHAKLDGKDGHPAPTVIAHDIAGSIVLRSHLIHGCDFESMLLCDTNAVLPWGDGFYKLVRSEPQTFLQMPQSIHEAVVRAVVRSACHDPRVLQAGWEDTLTQPWLGDEGQRSFVRQIAQANDADVSDMLEDNLYAKVKCDIKIVWGEQDQWIPKEKIEELVARSEGRVKECAFLPAAGHLVMLDQPSRFAVEVFHWLERKRLET